MIICPECETILTRKNASWICENCGYKAETDNGIVCFDPKIDDDFADYDPAALEVFYQYEKNHFWFRIRRDLIKDIFKRYVRNGEKVIEIGAGTGNISKMLLQNGYDMAIGDVHKRALQQFDGGEITQKYQFDVTKTPFREHFDVIGIFDVLEHIEKDKLAIRKIHAMLKSGGRAIVTVPAHQWLWSKYDATHKRRYELETIRKIFENNGFDIVMAKNFFVSIVPLLYLRSILYKSAGKEGSEELAEGQIKINRIVNIILYYILKAENKLLKKISPKIGGSIIIVAIKK